MTDTISLRDHRQPCEHGWITWHRTDIDGTVDMGCPGGKERTYRQIRLVRMGGYVGGAWYQAKPEDKADEIVLVEVTE